MEVSGQLHAQVALHPRERDPGTHWIGGWVSSRAGLDALVNPCREMNPDHQARGPVTVLTELQRLHTNLLCTFTFRPRPVLVYLYVTKDIESWI